MYFVEFSREQRAFHVDPVADLIQRNLDSFKKGEPVDYVPLGMFATEAEAHAFCDTLKPIRDGWETGSADNDYLDP